MPPADPHAINAFVPDSHVSISGATRSPLTGLTFAAKDLFDVAGYVTGAGNPDWARTHEPATKHAWAVQTLLDAGADLVGKPSLTNYHLAFSARIHPTAHPSTSMPWVECPAVRPRALRLQLQLDCATPP